MGLRPQRIPRLLLDPGRGEGREFENLCDQAIAADAAKLARASGIISFSAEIRLIVTKVSA